MPRRFHTCDVFTDRVFGGNPLAVFPDGRGIDDATMQAVAREFNLSETVFVLPPEDPAHTRALRIFTPGRELPFAGHPTIGTAFVLAAIGEVALSGDETEIVFEEGVGPVPVTIFAADAAPTSARLTAARPPEFGPEPPAVEAIAAMLSLEPGDVLGGADAPRAVSCGVPFLFVTLRDRAALARSRVDPGVWADVMPDYWADAVYLIAHDPELPGSDLRARMYSPDFGIPEDPATGSAATALAGYLGQRDAVPDGRPRWVVEQGFEMGRPSLIEVEAEKADGAIATIRVGGASVLVGRGEMDIPE